jgi:hypothetical protein
MIKSSNRKTLNQDNIWSASTQRTLTAYLKEHLRNTTVHPQSREIEQFMGMDNTAEEPRRVTSELTNY